MLRRASFASLDSIYSDESRTPLPSTTSDIPEIDNFQWSDADSDQSSDSETEEEHQKIIIDGSPYAWSTIERINSETGALEVIMVIHVSPPGRMDDVEYPITQSTPPVAMTDKQTLMEEDPATGVPAAMSCESIKTDHDVPGRGSTSSNSRGSEASRATANDPCGTAAYRALRKDQRGELTNTRDLVQKMFSQEAGASHARYIRPSFMVRYTKCTSFTGEDLF